MGSSVIVRFLQHAGRREFVLSAAYIAAMAAILSLATEGRLALRYFVVAYGIGLPVQVCMSLGRAYGSPRLPRPALRFVMAGCGLVIGLAVGGMLLEGRPGLLFADGAAVLMAVLVWGLAGVGFEALENLRDARARLDRAERDRLASEKTLAQAELRVLQAQVEPHFLFNALANVIALVRTHPGRAVRVLEHLTALLRASLSRARSAEGTLDDELATVRTYLDVQALRMAGRMTYQVSAEHGLERVSIPPLLVQPLVENAVLHGIEPSAGGGRVTVRAERVAGFVRLRVTDNGVGLDAGRVGSGFGMANVRERLRAAFGERSRLVLEETPEGGVSAELWIPAAAREAVAG